MTIDTPTTISMIDEFERLSRMVNKIIEDRDSYQSKMFQARGEEITATENLQRSERECERLQAELDRWESGQRRKMMPIVESVPDGLHYAAELVRSALGVEDELLAKLMRESGMRLKELNDSASILMAEATVGRAEINSFKAQWSLIRQYREDNARLEELLATVEEEVKALRDAREQDAKVARAKLVAHDLHVGSLLDSYRDLAVTGDAMCREMMELANDVHKFSGHKIFSLIEECDDARCAGAVAAKAEWKRVAGDVN